MKHCKECLYFIQKDDVGGVCRRYPPTPILAPAEAPTVLAGKRQPMLVIKGFFPLMELDEPACGEFTPRLALEGTGGN